MANVTWDLAAIEKEMLEWTQNPAALNLKWDRPVASIRQSVRPDATEREFLVPPLSELGMWEGMNGAVAVLNGDPAGWGRLAKSANFWYWNLRILIHRFDRDNQPNERGGARSINVAHCLSHLITNGWIDQAKWLGGRLALGFSDRGIYAWPHTPFEPFMACLYQRWQRIVVGGGLPASVDLGAYAQVLESLEGDDASFNASLTRACDYHVARSVALDDNSFYPEFRHLVYKAFPAEILAIQQVRASLGHNVPPLKHTLLDNPLAHPPMPTPSGEDELWMAAVAKAKSLWPDF